MSRTAPERRWWSWRHKRATPPIPAAAGWPASKPPHTARHRRCRRRFISSSADRQWMRAVGDVDSIDRLLPPGRWPPFGRFRRDVTDGQPRSATGKPAVGDQRADLAQSLGFQVAGRVEHLLHTRPPSGTFIADHNHIAGLDLPHQNRCNRVFLAFHDAPAVPRKTRMLSSTPAVLTIQPSSAKLPYSTANPPS
jgi:hypothetical protein